MRAEFHMTDEQHKRLLEACKPVPAMWIGGPPSSPQENANYAWQQLARELGFVWDTVTPIPGKDERWFSAESASPLPDQHSISGEKR